MVMVADDLLPVSHHSSSMVTVMHLHHLRLLVLLLVLRLVLLLLLPWQDDGLFSMSSTGDDD